MIQVVLFDFFGVICNKVLLDWGRQRRLNQAGFRALARLGNSVDRGDISLAELHAQLGALCRPALSAEQVASQLNLLVRLNPELVELLGRLRGRCQVGILSNVNADFLAGALSAQQIGPYFEPGLIFASSAFGLIKPDIDLYRRVQERMGYSADQIFFTDDDPANLQPALSLGWRVEHFTHTKRLTGRLEELGVLPRF